MCNACLNLKGNGQVECLNRSLSPMLDLGLQEVELTVNSTLGAPS